MNITAITQARLNSTRLPGKVLLPVGNKSVLQIHLERLRESRKINKIIVATTTNETDSAIADLCESLNFEYFRGAEIDVLDRYYQAAKIGNPDYIVRVTSDCPLIDGDLIDSVIDFTIERGLDYVSNRLRYQYPDGIVVEMFTFAALEKAWREAELKSEREHVAPYIWKNSTFFGKTLFASDNFCDISANYHGVRLTIDERADYELIKLLAAKFGDQQNWQVYADAVLNDERLKNINEHIIRNEGYLKSLLND